MGSMGRPDIRGRIDGVDDVDVAIVRALEANPLASYRELSAAVELNPRSVQRRLDALKSAGVVRVVALPHPQLEGAGSWFLRVSTAGAEADDVATWLASIEGTRSVRASRDGQEIVCAVSAPVLTAQRIVDDLDADPRVRRVIVSELFTIWSDAALHTVREPDRPLDAVDRRLIARLAEDARADTTEIAAALGIDPSTVLRRRSRLISEHVVRLITEVDRRIFDEMVVATIFVSMSPGAIRELGARLQSIPSCRFAAAAGGAWALVAEVSAADNSALMDFVDTELSDPSITGVEIVSTGRTYTRPVPTDRASMREDGVSAVSSRPAI